MNDLDTILHRNRLAVQLGVTQPGTLVGTANVQPASLEYPWSVQPVVNDELATRYVAINYETGFRSTYIHDTYDAAEREALLLQVKGEAL